MKFNLSQHEKLILSSVVVCFLGLALTLSQINFKSSKKSFVIEKIINYKMGKAIENFFTFSLSGREIERVIDDDSLIRKNLEKSDSRELSHAKSNSELNNQIKKPLNSSSFFDKKNKDKKTLEAQLADKKRAQAQKLLAEKQKIPVLPGIITPGLDRLEQNKNEEQNLRNRSDQNQQVVGAVFQNNESNADLVEGNNGTEGDSEIKDEKKSLAEIRAEFQSNPTREQIFKTVNDLNKGIISATDFNTFINEILASQNQQQIGLALYALRLVPSANSFTVMAKFQVQANESFKAYIQEGLLTYNQPNLISTFNLLLRSQDKIVSYKALEIVSIGVNEIKNGNFSTLTDRRNRRSIETSAFSLTNYVQLLPSLNELAQGTQDQSIIVRLQSTITLINEGAANIAANDP